MGDKLIDNGDIDSDGICGFEDTLGNVSKSVYRPPKKIARRDEN